MLKRFFKEIGAFDMTKYVPEHKAYDMRGDVTDGKHPFEIAQNIAAAIGEHFSGKMATDAKRIYDSIAKIDKVETILPFSTNVYPGGLLALQRDAMYLRDGGYYENGTFYIEEPETLKMARSIRESDISDFIERELVGIDLKSVDNAVLYNAILEKNNFDITFPNEVLKVICERYERPYIEIQPIDITSFEHDNGNWLNMFK